MNGEILKVRTEIISRLYEPVFYVLNGFKLASYSATIKAILANYFQIYIHRLSVKR